MINTFYITAKGREYIAQSMVDKSLVFTRGEFGKGVPAADVSPITLTALVSKMGPLDITKKEADGSTTIITTEFSNRVNGVLLPAFRLTEVGLYGKLQTPDGATAEKETLILYGYVSEAQGDYIDAVETSYVLNWPLVISDTANVSIEYVDTQHVDMESFEDAMADIEVQSFTGYRTVAGNSYSGIASNSGIDFGKVQGKSVQDGTPTPEAPAEIQSFGESMNIQSGTGQLINHEKLPTTSKDGVTVTNNGDGSFTVVGSGTPEGKTIVSYTVNDKSIFKAGKLRLLCGAMTNPYCNVFISSSGGSVQITNLFGSAETKELTEEILNGDNFYMTVAFSSSSDSFINGTIRPILYQDGNDELRPFEHATTTMNVPLRSLPNGVCDTYENGKIIRKIACVTLDGSDDEEYANSNVIEGSETIYFDALITSNTGVPNASAEDNVLCNRLKCTQIWGVDVEGVKYQGGTSHSIRFRILKSRLESADFAGLRKWLASNPIVVMYELASPTIEEVTLPTIPSWYDWTNVWHDGPETDITWHINLAGGKSGGITMDEVNEAINTAIGDAIAGSY